MRKGLKLLVLAGSAEARMIAAAARDDGADVTALMSEPPRGPNPMPVPYTLHKLDETKSIEALMREVDAVVDASHGFDEKMSRIGSAAAMAPGVPFLRYVRPGWSLEGKALWKSATDVEQAMTMIAPGARVFSAAGWASLSACAEFPGERLFLRQTNRHMRPVPFDFVELVFGEAPFTAESEAALFKELRIDTLLARNLGGQASYPKVAAAESLGLNVILISPPALPHGITEVDDVNAVLAWIDAQ